ncbi:MAG: Gfo/Idh/MocA family oxidoreductase [Salinisphaera sp.]|jgi:D-galactose 1-dehydrogenase|nr:Gfo/Idh/MocA family oxidoreductase [Salinisphaera sp.]
MAIRIAIVGYGKIAQDQHLPALAADARFELAAIVDPDLDAASLPEGVVGHADIEALLSATDNLQAVALCVPPQHRYALACRAIVAGKHVLLEKPPGITLSEVADLGESAREAGVTLYASWHSRHAPAIDMAREWLADKQMTSASIDWREDVRVFHPGQAWIWQAGGLGVFDPGINALSIVTDILPAAFSLTEATLSFPDNCETPIAAELSFRDIYDKPIEAIMDFRHEGTPAWQITVDTTAGQLQIIDGGARLVIEGETVVDSDKQEYAGVYGRFANLIEAGDSEVDVRPFRHVADAFMLGRRQIVEAFHE